MYGIIMAINRKLKIGSLASGLALATLPFGGWIPALVAAGVGIMVGNKQFPAGEKPWRQIDELLQEGEHGRLEFKQGLSDGKGSPYDGIIKSIAAFANTDGGELLIGVEDAGTVCGLEKEIKKFRSRDKLESAIRNAIRDNLDANVGKLYRLKFEEVNGETVCRIEVEKSSTRVFSLNRGDFYMRNGNRTIALSTREYHKLKTNEEF